MIDLYMTNISFNFWEQSHIDLVITTVMETAKWPNPNPTPKNVEKFHYSIGFGIFDEYGATGGVTFIKSEKSTLTARESIDLVSDQFGFYRGIGGVEVTMTSFASISREQYKTFRNEKKEEVKEKHARTVANTTPPNNGCILQ